MVDGGKDVEDDTEVASLLVQSLDPHPSQDSLQAARDLSGVLIARLTVRVCMRNGWDGMGQRIVMHMHVDRLNRRASHP